MFKHAFELAFEHAFEHAFLSMHLSMQLGMHLGMHLSMCCLVLSAFVAQIHNTPEQAQTDRRQCICFDIGRSQQHRESMSKWIWN
jgi:hypothetical protein